MSWGSKTKTGKCMLTKAGEIIGLKERDWPGSEVRVQETIPSYSAHDGCPEQVRMVQVHL